MPTTKIGPKHQITIPKKLFDRLHLEVGDLLDAAMEKGNIVLVPKRLVEKAPLPSLTTREQKLAISAKRKIERIRADLANAKGLSHEEARVAAKVGLIDKDQRWWWTEEWQKGEREAEREIRTGRTQVFETVEELIKDLRRP